LLVVCDNGGFLSVSLLKALFGDWSFFRVRTHDLNFLFGPDDVCALFLPRAVGLENVSESRDYHHWWCSCCYMFRLNDILLMHRWDVIDIFLIVIYFHYKVKLCRLQG
jgi:hypothetical protein